MGAYYDKDKFTGGRAPSGGRSSDGGQGSAPPPPRPPQKNQDNSGWYSWPLIIILFSLGIWPIALILLFFNIFGDDKNKSKKNSRETAAEEVLRRTGAQVERGIRQGMRQAESAVGRAVRLAEERTDSAAGKTDEALRKAAAEVERAIGRAAREVEQAGRSVQNQFGAEPRQAASTPPKAPAASKAKAPKPKKVKVKGKPAGTLLRILGGFFMFAGFCIGADFTSELLSSYYVEFEELFTSLGFLVSGGVMFFRGQYLGRMSRRAQRYIMAIGNVDAMPLSEIAKRVNRTPEKAGKELQKLIDKGYMGEDAYIDYDRGYFLRFGATLEEEPVPEPRRQEEPAAAPQPAAEAVEKGYSGILRSIRRANDRIADPELSRKIDRIEQVTGIIFREVEEHPEKRERIRTFFDYYLPTTQKLLDAYAEFEETGVEGENLRQAKERIEQTMDMIVEGFERQLDQLYSSDAMDVVTDIKVMEAMLNRDGASAAKDFGYPEPPKVRPKDGDASSKKDGGDFQTLQL